MSDVVELLSCPFCGGVANHDYWQGYRRYSSGTIDHAAAIYCTSCNASMTLCRGDTNELTDEDRMSILVEQWNKRATARTALGEKK